MLRDGRSKNVGDNITTGRRRVLGLSERGARGDDEWFCGVCLKPSVIDLVNKLTSVGTN